MKVYNPTGWDIEFMACKKIYKMKPFSVMEIGESQHCKVIFGPRHHASYDLGVVSLDYTESKAKLHESYEKFVIAQVEDGLNKAKRYRHEAWLNERQAQVDIKHYSKISESDRDVVNPEKFKALLDQVIGWIDDLKNGKHPACKLAKGDPNKVSLSDLNEQDRLELEQKIRAEINNEEDSSLKKRGRPKKDLVDGQAGNQGASAA